MADGLAQRVSDERLLTLEEVAALWGVDASHVQRWTLLGLLGAIPVGTRLRYSRIALDAFLHKAAEGAFSDEIKAARGRGWRAAGA